MKSLRRIKYLIFSFIFLFSLAAYADLDLCEHLSGTSNPEINRFGGLKPRTALQKMANLFLSYVPKLFPGSVQIGFPVFLESTLRQGEQFGDGQRNALASFGSLEEPPFVAVLTRDKSLSNNLALILSQQLPGFAQMKEIEVLISGNIQKFAIDKVNVSTLGLVRIPVDLQKLGWDQLYGAQPVFFRPVGWTDWFSVQFPNAYLTTEDFMSGLSLNMRSLPEGKSVLDPLDLRLHSDVQKALREREESKNLGFVLARVERSQRVHGAYVLDNGDKVLTATGGVWTRYRVGEPFKNVYLVKDPRVLDLEEEEGVVSGTGPHYIGATGEIIVNSVEQESLITFYGVTGPKSGPNQSNLAWGFTHQWTGTWLRPGHVFVTPQGMYHWHLNHLLGPVAAQVFTPPQVPSGDNHFGFPR